MSVAVKFIRIEKGDNTVQVITRSGGQDNVARVDPYVLTGFFTLEIEVVKPRPTFFRSLRERSLNETSQFQEPFTIYIQSLISQCLDPNFMNEVFLDQGIRTRRASSSGSVGH